MRTNDWFLSFFLAREDALDVIEFVEGLDGGKVVDIDGKDLVAYLAQDGIIKLEDGQLIARAAAGNIAQVLGQGVVVAVVGFQLLEHFIGSLDDGRRHTGQLSDMDTEAVLATSLDQLAHKHHLSVNLLDADVVVHDALEGFLHLVQLVVVGGTWCQCAEVSIIEDQGSQKSKNCRAGFVNKPARQVQL